jgi:hypothetical protein
MVIVGGENRGKHSLKVRGYGVAYFTHGRRAGRNVASAQSGDIFLYRGDALGKPCGVNTWLCQISQQCTIT